MGQRILALELAGERVRGAMAERSWKTLDLLGAWEQARVEGEPDLAPAIGRILAESGPADIVISALPAEFVAKRLLTLPFNDRRKLRQVVPFALEEHLPFPVDNAAVAFTRVGAEDGKTLVIAAFARKSDMRVHLDLMARAGLEPKRVTLGALALAGLLARARNGAHGAHLVIDIDHACTSMVLIDPQGTPRAIRTVGQGIAAHNGAALAPPATAAIVGAVRQTLLAHGSELDPPDIVLTGPAAAAPAIREQLGKALSAPVHDVDEFDAEALFGGKRPEPLRFAACLAMLLGEAPVKPLELLDFRVGEFAPRGGVRALGAMRTPIILAAVAAGFAALHFILGISIAARQINQVNRRIAAVVAPALGAADPATARGALENKIAGMRKRLLQMGGNLGHGSPLDVLLDLSRAIPAGLPAQIDDLTIDEGGVKLQGTADSFATVDQVKRALERSRDFTDVQVDHAAASSDSSKVEFRINLKVSDAALDAD